MSERVERKILGLLGDPRESPYGNPIPGLDELGGPAVVAADFRVGVESLPVAVDADPARREVVVRRLGEPLQTDTALMGRLAEAGLRPGVRRVGVSRSGHPACRGAGRRPRPPTGGGGACLRVDVLSETDYAPSYSGRENA